MEGLGCQMIPGLCTRFCYVSALLVIRINRALEGVDMGIGL